LVTHAGAQTECTTKALVSSGTGASSRRAAVARKAAGVQRPWAPVAGSVVARAKAAVEEEGGGKAAAAEPAERIGDATA